MLLQAAADLHGDTKKFDLFLEGIQTYSPHMAILAGDIIHQSPHPLIQLIDSLSIPLLLIPGNMDPPHLNQALRTPLAINLNGKQRVIHGYSFVGIGDTVPRNIYCENTKKAMPLKKIDMDILISHRPPQGFLDQTRTGEHIGSKDVIEILNENHPCLVICGHAHENPGYQKINNTLIVNCSIGQRGQFSLITLDDTITIKMVGH
jgi:Icc-related predicted phosphoesterase